MIKFPRRTSTRIVLPAGVLNSVVDRALAEWGPGAFEDDGAVNSQVLFWQGGHNLLHAIRRGRPVGGFRVRWGAPSRTQATVEELCWDPTLGGSEIETRQVIDTLVGWPVGAVDVRGARNVSTGRLARLTSVGPRPPSARQLAV